MATPERDTVYSTETNRTAYTRESSSTGWFVGIIVALALLAIGYLVFSANNNGGAGTTNVDVNNSPALTSPADPAVSAPADTNTTPLAVSEDAAAPAAGTDAAAPAGDAAAPAAGADAAAPAAGEATTPAQ